MKKLALLLALLLSGAAQAQQVDMPPPAGTVAFLCAYNASPPALATGHVGYAQCDINGKIITSGGGGGSLSATATAAAPTYVEGSSDPLSMDLSGNTRVIVANTNANLATNADGIAGVAAGAVGAGSPVNSANYAWNGSTWDRAKAQGDPCAYQTKQPFTISTSSGTLQLVAPSGSTQVYICSLFTIGATASIQNIVGGTGATCTTGTPIAIAGSTTAANGMSFAANGGFTFGNGGGTILRTTTAGHGVCLIQSATALIAGGGTYVQQ